MAVEESGKSKKWFLGLKKKKKKWLEENKDIIASDREMWVLPGKYTVVWALLHVNLMISISDLTEVLSCCKQVMELVLQWFKTPPPPPTKNNWISSVPVTILYGYVEYLALSLHHFSAFLQISCGRSQHVCIPL